MTLAEARALYNSLTPGDAVILTVDGQEHAVTVQRTASGDTGGHGHYDSRRTTVGYGPGRWNTEVTPAGLAAGNYSIRRDE